MSAFRDALAVEARKARSARVPFATGALLATGVSVLASTVVLAARSGNSELVAKLGPRAASGDWSALLSGAAQITSAAGLLACGVVISWIYGREFADGTVSALFGLPVSRGTLAVAKATVYAAWSVLVTLATTVLLLVAGLTIGLGPPDSDTFAGLGRQACLGVLTALIAAPAGWASTLGRGLLPGIAAAIGILVTAQILVLADAATWVPFAAPALWAMSPSTSSAWPLLLVPLVPLVFGAATVLGWQRLQLDR
jgi:ABC-2 type transport system permease protein